jgi:hypothetical protein
MHYLWHDSGAVAPHLYPLNWLLVSRHEIHTALILWQALLLDEHAAVRRSPPPPIPKLINRAVYTDIPVPTKM